MTTSTSFQQRMGDSTIPFRSVLVYGMGMMGASFALALRGSGAFHGRLTGIVRSEKSASFIMQHGMADNVVIQEDLSQAKNFPCSDYDLIVLGIPIQSIVNLFSLLPPCDTLITDISSTRRDVHEAARQRPDLRFVGSHPMCGSEDSGPSAARADLFHNRLCIITTSHADEAPGTQSDVKAILSLWKSIGMKTFTMDPEDHDHVLAYLSHAPHILAALIATWADNAGVVQNATGRSPTPITGGGFRDMVRIAGSNPEMWSDILFTNTDFIAASLKDYRDRLDRILRDLETGELDRAWWLQWFHDARISRNRLSGYPEDK